MYTVWHCTDQHRSFMYVCTYRLVAGTWRPLVIVITTLYCVANSIFHSRVWYRTLSQFSALCVYFKFGQHDHPQATFVPNFVSLAASIAELTQEEKIGVINHSLTHPAYLIPQVGPGTESCASEYNIEYCSTTFK